MPWFCTRCVSAYIWAYRQPSASICTCNFLIANELTLDQQCPQHTSIKETKEAMMYSQWPKIHKYFIYWTVTYITWSRYYANIISTALCRTGWKAVKEEQRSFTTDWPSMQQAAVRKVTTLKLLTMQLLQSLSTTDWLWQPWLSQTDYRLQEGMLNCTMTGRRGVLIHHILS